MEAQFNDLMQENHKVKYSYNERIRTAEELMSGLVKQICENNNGNQKSWGKKQNHKEGEQMNLRIQKTFEEIKELWLPHEEDNVQKL